MRWGRTILLKVSECDTVKKLKTYICELEGSPRYSQQILLGSQILEDEHVLAEVVVLNLFGLTLIVCLPGWCTN